MISGLTCAVVWVDLQLLRWLDRIIDDRGNPKPNVGAFGMLEILYLSFVPAIFYSVVASIGYCIMITVEPPEHYSSAFRIAKYSTVYFLTLQSVK